MSDPIAWKSVGAPFCGGMGLVADDDIRDGVEDDRTHVRHPETRSSGLSATAEPLVAIGADGIPGGWIVAACHLDRHVWSQARAEQRLPLPSSRRIHLKRCLDVSSIAALRLESHAIVAIDVPLGLLEDGGARPCDSEARRLLGDCASAVFNPPARYLFAALAKPTKERWDEIKRLVSERQAAHPEKTIPGVSRQTVGILPKVADADSFLRAHRDAQAWMVECHPDVSFLRMKGNGVLAPKAKAKGTLDRLALVEHQFPGTQHVLDSHPLATVVTLPDLLDAYAALWTALRVACGVVHPVRDALGLGADGRLPRSDGLYMRILA